MVTPCRQGLFSVHRPQMNIATVLEPRPDVYEQWQEAKPLPWRSRLVKDGRL
jgi:hypothetical protein